MKSKNQVWLMRWYLILVACILLAPTGLKTLFDSSTIFGPAGVLVLVIPILAGITFYFMYQTGKESRGGGYAKKNLIIALLLSPILGLGIFLWPPLIYSESRRAQPVAGGDATR